MSLIIDGVTGEIIGTTERKAAKLARPAFEGKTVKGGRVITTRVIPKPQITKVKKPIQVDPTAAPGVPPVVGEIIASLLKGGTLDAVAEQMMKNLERKLGTKLPRPHRLW